jgi:multidrug efflux pump
MRRTLGTAVFSGMLGVTFFGIFLTPVFFLVIDRLTNRLVLKHPALRWVSKVLLDSLRLGFLRRPARWAIARVAASGKYQSRSPEKPILHIQPRLADSEPVCLAPHILSPEEPSRPRPTKV